MLVQGSGSWVQGGELLHTISRIIEESPHIDLIYTFIDDVATRRSLDDVATRRSLDDVATRRSLDDVATRRSVEAPGGGEQGRGRVCVLRGVNIIHCLSGR